MYAYGQGMIHGPHCIGRPVSLLISQEITNDTPDPLTVLEAHNRVDWP